MSRMRTHYGNWVVGAERSYRWFNHGPGEFEQDLIVVVPGWDGAPSSGQIERLVKRLAPHGAVLVPLLRGTDRYNPDWSFWTMRRHAMDIAALLTRQVAHGIIDRTTRFSMASHSLGAMATLTFASAASRLAPDVPDLDLMVLFGTSLGLPHPLPKQAPPSVPEPPRTLVTDGVDTNTKAAPTRVQASNPAHDRARHIRQVLAVLTFPHGGLDNIRARTVIIHGTEDQMIPVEAARRMQHALRTRGVDLTYIEIPEVGHTDVLDHPEAIRALTAAFAQPSRGHRPRARLSRRHVRAMDARSTAEFTGFLAASVAGRLVAPQLKKLGWFWSSAKERGSGGKLAAE